MKSSDALFQLIKSLNKAEKRNFKLLTNITAGHKKYLQLFEIIDRQEVYNEAKILRMFKSKKVATQIAVAKNYLYNNILRSLAYFYKGPKAELNNQLVQIHILVEKNLQHQALKLVRKCRIMAESQEKFSGSLFLLNQEREILQEMQSYKKFGYFIEEIEKKELESLAKQQNLLSYQHLFDEIVKITKTTLEARSLVEKSDFTRVLSDPLMSSLENAKSAKAKVVFCVIMDYIHRYNLQIEGCIEWAERACTILDENPEIRAEWIIRYINEKSNLCTYLINRRQMEKAWEGIIALKGLDERGEKAKQTLFVKSFILSIAFFHTQGNAEKGMQEIELLEEGLKKFMGELPKGDELLLYYSAARFCNLAGEHSRALKWINRFLNEPRTEVRADLQCYARILNLIIHYELGNNDFVNHQLKSTYRFIYKKDRMHEIERAVLRFIRDLSIAEQGTLPREKFESLRVKVGELSKNPMERVAFNMLDIHSWLLSRSMGISYQKVVLQDYAESLQERDERIEKGGRF